MGSLEMSASHQTFSNVPMLTIFFFFFVYFCYHREHNKLIIQETVAFWREQMKGHINGKRETETEAFSERMHISNISYNKIEWQ